MNEKQITDLIERMRELGHVYSYQGAKILIREYEKLNKPEKVVVPQFVADWIKVAKPVYSLSGAMVYGSPGVNKWLESWDNQETFARAWLDGYEVEKEKRYLVKIKGIDPDFDILKYNLGARNWFTGSRHEYSSFRLHHTRKELEDADFGWVFSCEGVEVKEVKE
nr:MAG TPA: Protein of unknown function (DUF1642) [Bacteriophage sp.]